MQSVTSFAITLSALSAAVLAAPHVGLLEGVVDTVAPITTGLGITLNGLLGIGPHGIIHHHNGYPYPYHHHHHHGHHHHGHHRHGHGYPYDHIHSREAFYGPAGYLHGGYHHLPEHRHAGYHAIGPHY